MIRTDPEREGRGGRMQGGAIAASLDRSLSILPIIERKALIDQVRDILFEHEMDSILEESRKPDQLPIPVCPKCGSLSSVGYGYTDGRQRHKCKDCGRTFSDKPKRSMIFTSKLPKSTWMKYINCFVDDLPIAKCAERCGVSAPTAYYMRMRIQDLIEQTQEAWTLGSGERAQIDETFVYESFKGNRTKCEDFEMPRPAYVRGRKKDKRRLRATGKSDADHVCILTGADERRNTFLEIAGRSMMDSKSCREALSGKLEEGCCIVTDELNAYVGVLNALKVKHTAHISTDVDGSLGNVNALHSHFKNFIARKRGVSTRRFPLYLVEFAWRWQATINDSADQTVKRVVQKIAQCDYRSVQRDFRTSPYPLMDWWESPAGERECERMKIAIMEHNLGRAAEEAGDDPDMQAVVQERRDALEKRKQRSGAATVGKKTVTGGRSWKGSAPVLTTGMLRSKPV